MMKTHVYIAVDSCSTRISKKNYAYILECTVAGEIVTKEGYGQAEGSYHKAVLEAIADALERFTKPCEITIHAENTFILNMFTSYLEKWAENGFLTAKGKPITNREEWIRVHKASAKHEIHTDPGKHAYSKWLAEKMEKNAASTCI